MKEDTDNCGVYLEFIYNYNMEYVDSFDPWVNTVDIFVFDADERFLYETCPAGRTRRGEANVTG